MGIKPYSEFLCHEDERVLQSIEIIHICGIAVILAKRFLNHFHLGQAPSVPSLHESTCPASFLGETEVTWEFEEEGVFALKKP